MNRLNTNRLVISVCLAGAAMAAVVPVQAQPMMGDMGMRHDQARMHERMTQHWEQRQANLKAKLHLSAAQEPAWATFMQSMNPLTKSLEQTIDRDALAKLKTPERMEKMNAAHEANLATMQTHMKQRTEATRAFYNQLNAEQQKVFDAETLPEHAHWKGKRD